MRFSFVRCAAPVLAGIALLSLANTARAQTIRIAVFGDNLIDDLINFRDMTGTSPFGLTNYHADLVTAAEIAAGILQDPVDPFSVFIYTRPRGSFGPSLGGAATMQVQNFVNANGRGPGKVVLLNGDFADALSAPRPDPPLGPGGAVADPIVQRIIANSVIFAAESGHGYIGEYPGAIAGLTANSELTPRRTPLGFVEGFAGEVDFGGGNADGSLVATPVGATHPVLAGVAGSLPYNPTPDTLTSVEFGAEITGVDPSLVIATWGQGASSNPAIIAGTARLLAEIPEPATPALLVPGLLALVSRLARRRRA